MKLETIYGELLEIMKNDMDFTKALSLKEKLELLRLYMQTAKQAQKDLCDQLPFLLLLCKQSYQI